MALWSEGANGSSRGCSHFRWYIPLSCERYDPKNGRVLLVRDCQFPARFQDTMNTNILLEWLTWERTQFWQIGFEALKWKDGHEHDAGWLLFLWRKSLLVEKKATGAMHLESTTTATRSIYPDSANLYSSGEDTLPERSNSSKIIQIQIQNVAKPVTSFPFSFLEPMNILWDKVYSVHTSSGELDKSLLEGEKVTWAQKGVTWDCLGRLV